MIKTQALVKYLGDFLNVSAFKDYCHNGLQVQGCEQISNIVSGVSANLELIKQAVELGADAILTHHGIFWQGDLLSLVGPKFQRVQSLINNDINLLSYHLPLDAHASLGNNASIAEIFAISNVAKYPAGEVEDLIWIGEIESTTGILLASQISKTFNREPIHIKSEDTKIIQKVAWCTGAGQDFIDIASDLGADAYITGEISERTVHLAKELGIDFFAAGHHATEILGIKKLGTHIAEEFGLQHTFIDIPNPI